MHGNHDAARLLQLIALTATLSTGPPFQRGATPTRWIGLTVGVWAVLACSFAAEPTAALRECVLMLGLAAFALQIASCPSTRRWWLSRALCGIGLTNGLSFFITVLVVLLVDGEVIPFHVVSGFDNPRHLNHTQTVLIPLALGLATAESNFRWRFVGWASACLGLAAAAFLMGRATLLSVGVGVILGGLLLKGDAWPYFKAALSSAVVGLTLGLGLLFVFKANIAGQAVATGSGYNRLILWRAALDDAGQSIFGVGPMHFSRIERGDAAHPHNFYLQTAAEFGWPAAVALVAVVLWALTALARHVKRSPAGADRQRGLSLWVTMVAIALDACLSGNLVMPLSQVWVALAVGLALAWYGDHTAVTLSPSPTEPWARYGIAASMLVLTFVSLVEFMQPEVRLLESQYRHQPAGDTFSPRFWRDGWF